MTAKNAAPKSIMAVRFQAVDLPTCKALATIAADALTAKVASNLAVSIRVLWRVVRQSRSFSLHSTDRVAMVPLGAHAPHEAHDPPST